jgi:putative ABC transport system permease protein
MWRGLMKNKFYTAINILGLTIGMASAILILLWIQNEMSHDRFHAKIDRLYSANNRDMVSGKLVAWSTTPKPLAPALKKDYPEVEDVVRVNDYAANYLLSFGDKSFSLHGVFVDTGFLNMFSFPLLEGNARTALNDVNSIVLTKQLAIKLFGKEDAMGKTVRLDRGDNLTVTGVLKDLPNNTSFKFEYILPWSYFLKKGNNEDGWQNNSVYTFILLKSGVSQTAFDAKIKNITINHAGPGEKFTTQVFTQPFADKWLYGKSENGEYVAGKIEKVKMFAVIALLILVIACINFVNLSTARSEKRGKEVGIRKVAGALKSSLIAQFIGESIVLAAMAGTLAILIVQLILPFYNDLIETRLFIDYGNPYYWIFAGLFLVLTGLLAGIYPAFYLSSFIPVKVLKGTFKFSNAAVTPRKILVVLQFTFAIVLIICTIIVQNQINYAQNRDAGYSRNNLAFMLEFGDAGKNYKLIKSDLLASGAATAVAETSAPMTESWGDSWGFSWQGSTEDDKKIDFSIFSTDEDFEKTMDAKIVQGRGIDINTYKTDSTACLLNESAVKIMRLKDPIGQTIRNGKDTLHVVGVIKDFILNTPYEPVEQMIVCGPTVSYFIINFKLNPNPSIKANLAKAEAVFKKYNPHYPFNVRFYDKEYELKFHDEMQTGTLAGLFAGLTIFIACLGLLGLTTYMAHARIKEIGIRKVLGASVQNITTLLSKDFLRLVFISFVIASPVAWWFMHNWLASYSYRVNISLWVFIAAGSVSTAIAFITVSFQAIKAAIANPVKSLRTE